MKRLIIIHLVFLVVALLIAFVLIPMEKIFFDKVAAEWAESYYRDAITFNSYKAWGVVFTWFLGLSCGRLILRAIMR